MQPDRGSNPGHLTYRVNALPTELPGQFTYNPLPCNYKPLLHTPPHNYNSFRIWFKQYFIHKCLHAIIYIQLYQWINSEKDPEGSKAYFICFL